MYPSALSKWNIRDATKFKRDPMAELSEACRKNGVHFGFYYSHAFDWEHPDAPGNDWDFKNGVARTNNPELVWRPDSPPSIPSATWEALSVLTSWG